VPLAPTPRAPRLSRVGLLLLLYSGLTLLAVGWGAARGRPDVVFLDRPFVPLRSLAGIGIGIGFALVVVFLSRFGVHRFQWVRTLHQEFRNLLGPLTGGEIFLIALASSVGEECFFRGALAPHLGIWISSGLFALVHIGPGARFLPWTLTSFVLGLAMSLLATQVGDLGGPIAAHFTINLLNLKYIAERDLG
jgi:membrane protease YdiL (CAAX protease family)